jgi:hypothetical protein
MLGELFMCKATRPTPVSCLQAAAVAAAYSLKNINQFFFNFVVNDCQTSVHHCHIDNIKTCQSLDQSLSNA